jgi:putative spermidine/putrescine transport system permease protein
VTAPYGAGGQPVIEDLIEPPARSGRRVRIGWGWLGLVPFVAVAILFMIGPTFYLVIGSLKDAQGNWTLNNFAQLFGPQISQTYVNSIQISLATALIGGLFGFLLAYSVILGGLPRFLRSTLMTFSGVASNFAGIPLALAFTFTLGATGLVTTALNGIGIHIYDAGFSLYSKIGLGIVYLFFQFPLMVLIIAPAIDGLKKDWREAAENMGASPAQYWRRIALPILTPPILGTMILLFGNAFGAQATAYQLTGGFIDIVPIAISRQMRGDVLFDPNLGYALAMGMVVIMALSILAYSILQRRAERWLK